MILRFIYFFNFQCETFIISIKNNPKLKVINLTYQQLPSPFSSPNYHNLHRPHFFAPRVTSSIDQPFQFTTKYKNVHYASKEVMDFFSFFFFSFSFYLFHSNMYKQLKNKLNFERKKQIERYFISNIPFHFFFHLSIFFLILKYK